MPLAPDLRRTWLFGPGADPAAHAAMAACGADVLIMDLEDSTPPPLRPAARAGAPVDYTDSIKKRGRITTDALLAGGNRWFHTAGASGEVPSAVAKKTISYSFIDPRIRYS